MDHGAQTLKPLSRQQLTRQSIHRTYYVVMKCSSVLRLLLAVHSVGFPVSQGDSASPGGADVLGRLWCSSSYCTTVQCISIVVTSRILRGMTASLLIIEVDETNASSRQTADCTIHDPKCCSRLGQRLKLAQCIRSLTLRM
jgi:hypothetical protein